MIDDGKNIYLTEAELRDHFKLGQLNIAPWTGARSVYLISQMSWWERLKLRLRFWL